MRCESYDQSNIFGGTVAGAISDNNTAVPTHLKNVQVSCSSGSEHVVSSHGYWLARPSKHTCKCPPLETCSSVVLCSKILGSAGSFRDTHQSCTAVLIVSFFGVETSTTKECGTPKKGTRAVPHLMSYLEDMFWFLFEWRGRGVRGGCK